MAIVMNIHLKARKNRVVQQCIDSLRKNCNLHQQEKHFDSILLDIYNFYPFEMNRHHCL